MIPMQLKIHGSIIWVWGTIQDMNTYNIQLQNDIKDLEEWRENDIFLMDEIIRNTPTTLTLLSFKKEVQGQETDNFAW